MKNIMKSRFFKRIGCLFIALAVVLTSGAGLVPAAKVQADSGKVTVSVLSYDGALVNRMEVPMDVFDISAYTGGAKVTDFTALHAIIYALKHGTKLDLTNENDFKCKGSYISTVNGLSEFDAGTQSGWMYVVNKIKPSNSVSQQKLTGGDEVVLYYSGGMDNPYAYFTEKSTTVALGDKVTLTLQGNYGDLDKSDIRAVAGTSIEINGKPSEYTTDGSGNFTFTPSAAGTYRIEAKNYTKDASGNLTVSMNCAAAEVVVKEPVEGKDADLKSLSIEGLDGQTVISKNLSPAFDADTVSYTATVSSSTSDGLFRIHTAKVNEGATENIYIRPYGEAFEKLISTNETDKLFSNLAPTGGVSHIRIEVIAPKDTFVKTKNYYLDVNVVSSKKYAFAAALSSDGTVLKDNYKFNLAYSYSSAYPAYLNSRSSTKTYYPGFTYDPCDAAAGVAKSTPLYGILSTLINIDYNIKDPSKFYYTVSDMEIKSINGLGNSTEGSLEYAIDGIEQTLPMGAENPNLKDGSIVTLYYKKNDVTQSFISTDKNEADVNKNINVTVKSAENKAVSDAEIYINGTDSGKKTDDDGKAVLSFSKKGSYLIGAKKIEYGIDKISCAPVTVTVSGVCDLLSLDISKTAGADGSISSDLLPSFNPDVTDYTINVDKNTEYLYFKPVTGAAGSMVYKYYKESGEIKYDQCVLNDYKGYIKGFNTQNQLYDYDTGSYLLHGGSNTCKIIVFSEDVKQSKVYTIHINKEKESDARLTELACAGGNFKDKAGNAFSLDNGSREYYASVNYDTSLLRLFCMGNKSSLQFESKNKITQDANRADMFTMPLDEGDSIITVKSTAEDGVKTETYILHIKRTRKLDFESTVITPGKYNGCNGTTMNYQVPYDTNNFDFSFTVEEGASVTIDRKTYESGSKINFSFADTTDQNSIRYWVLSKNVTINKAENGLNLSTTRTLDFYRSGNPDLSPSSLTGYLPAPGQFTNGYNYGNPFYPLCGFINNDNLTDVLSLGAFGGYSTYHFNTPITNSDKHKYGIDFIIYGNAFPGNAEPGGVMVAQDKNNDGKPDEWYTLAGSAHYDDTTKWDYSVTYYNPANYPQYKGLTYWRDNYGKNGTVDNDGDANYPDSAVAKAAGWNTTFSSDQLTLSGTLIGSKDIDFGYFDVHPHTKNTGTLSDSVIKDGFESAENPYTDEGISYGQKGDGMDISWAVDSKGNPVHLEEISFVKCYTAVLSYGSCGEVSSELGGIVCVKDAEASVGRTKNLSSLKIVSGDNDSIETAVNLKDNTESYEIHNAPSSFKLSLGSTAQNIYVNGTRLNDKTQSEEISLNEDGTRLVRIILQNGDEEPEIYLLHFYADKEVQKVKELVNELPDIITLDKEDAVNVALNAYNALTKEQKCYVSKEVTVRLSAAQTSINKLKEFSNSLVEKSMESAITWAKQGNKYLLNSIYLQAAGTSDGDWMPMTLGRLNYIDDAEAYLNKIADYITRQYAQNGTLSTRKATEYHRIALAVLALGGNPTVIGKDKNGNPVNLIADGIFYRGQNETNSLGYQGINGYIFGLICLDAGKYKVPSDAVNTRSSIIKEIIAQQKSDGGFTLSGDKSDVDITAMALQALAPYYSSTDIYPAYNGELKTAGQVIDQALNVLSSMQKSDGDFETYGTVNAESTAQVVMALCALGIDPDSDLRFIKNGHTTIDSLLKYQMSGGGFAHILDTEGNGKIDNMATDQSTYALVSYYRLKNSLNSFYDMTDALKASELSLIKRSAEKSESISDKDAITALINKINRMSGFYHKAETLKLLTDALYHINHNSVEYPVNPAPSDKQSTDKNKNSTAEKNISKEIKSINNSIEQNADEKSSNIVNMITKLNVSIPQSEAAVNNISEIYAVYKAYQRLTDDEKKLVTNHGILENMIETIRRQIQMDKNRYISISGTPWYIGITVNAADSSVRKSLQNKIEDGSKLLLAYDISLTDYVTGSSYEPNGEQVKVTMPVPDYKGYDGIIIIHQKSDGSAEYIKPSIRNDGTMKFILNSFSTIAVLGYKDNVQKAAVTEESGLSSWIWFAVADAVIIIIGISGVVLYKNKKRKN